MTERASMNILNSPRAYGLETDMSHVVGTSADELHTRMLSMELLGRPQYDTSAHYISVRRLLVDWICEIVEKYKLSHSTAQVAVGYVDRVLQGMEVHRSRYQLVAMACFAIAAKYEEAEELVPTAAKINEFGKHVYEPSLLNQMEILVLSRLDWKLTVVTPAHFANLYCGKGILFHSDSLAYKALTPRVIRYLKKYVDFFAEITLQEYVFQQYVPSLLAAAIVLAARKSLVIRPLWTPELAEVTRYSEEEVVPIMVQIWQLYRKSFPREALAQDTQADEADRIAVESGALDASVQLPFYYSLYAESVALPVPEPVVCIRNDDIIEPAPVHLEPLESSQCSSTTAPSTQSTIRTAEMSAFSSPSFTSRVFNATSSGSPCTPILSTPVQLGERTSSMLSVATAPRSDCSSSCVSRATSDGGATVRVDNTENSVEAASCCAASSVVSSSSSRKIMQTKPLTSYFLSPSDNKDKYSKDAAELRTHPVNLLVQHSSAFESAVRKLNAGGGS